MLRYDSYKPSGVEWLGEIPSHWKISALKHIARLQSGEAITSMEMDNGEYPVFGGNGFRGLFSKYTHDGEFVLIGRQGALCGNINYAEGKFWASEHAIVATPVQLLATKWLGELLRAMNLNQYSIAAAQPGLAVQTIANLRIPVPPLDEQFQISKFLDQKTAEIDTAIAKKQRLIELLQEQKSILINQAVTRGLNPNVPMRDSGVEWIGQIPAHWDVLRAKYLFKEIDERSETGTEELLSVSHMTGVTPRSEKNVNMFMAEDYSGSKLCQPNDLIFNIMWAWMGALGVSELAGIVSPAYGVYRQLKSGTFNNWYLEQLLRSSSYVAEYNRRSRGLHSSRLRLYADMFFDMEIAIPPRFEQDEIEARTKAHVSKADEVISATEREIEKLAELRSTLIASAVTGQIKV